MWIHSEWNFSYLCYINAWNRGIQKYTDSFLILDWNTFACIWSRWVVQNIRWVYSLWTKHCIWVFVEFCVAGNVFSELFPTLVILPRSDPWWQQYSGEVESSFRASQHSALVFPSLTIQTEDRSGTELSSGSQHSYYYYFCRHTKYIQIPKE